MNYPKTFFYEHGITEPTENVAEFGIGWEFSQIWWEFDQLYLNLNEICFHDFQH